MREPTPPTLGNPQSSRPPLVPGSQSRQASPNGRLARLPSLRGRGRAPSTALRGAGDAFLDSIAGSEGLAGTATASTADTDVSTQRSQRRLRQFYTREEKQRTAVEVEAATAWEGLLAHETWSRAAIARFSEYRERHDEAAAARQASWSVWQVRVLGDALDRLVEEEEARRVTLVRLETEERHVLASWKRVEGEPLWVRHRVVAVMAAERIRRNFIYSEEVQEALAMDIPMYEPEYVVVVRGEGDDEACVTGEKIDYMRNQCCPYRHLESCPFLPAPVRVQLERKAAREASANSRNGIAARRPLSTSGRRARGPRMPSASSRRLAEENAANTGLQMLIRATMKKGHFKHTEASTLTATASAPMSAATR